jgi:hypothetical protein
LEEIDEEGFGTHPTRGNNTSGPSRSVTPQTTSVGKVTSEVHTSIASVEAPSNTRRNRKSDCVYKPRESLKSYNGFIVVKVGDVVVGLPGASILLGQVIPGGESFGLFFVRLFIL